MAAKKKIAPKYTHKSPAKKPAPKAAPKAALKKPAPKVALKKAAPKKKSTAPFDVLSEAEKKKKIIKVELPKKHAPARAALPDRKDLSKSAAKASLKKVAAAAPAKPRSDTDYRNLRKYTYVRLTELAAQPDVVRTAIGKPPSKAVLSLEDFITYLTVLEKQLSPWRRKQLPPPDGKPRKRGRPSKADIAAREAAVDALQTPNETKAAFAKVHSLVAKKLTVSAPAKPVLKLVRKA